MHIMGLAFFQTCALKFQLHTEDGSTQFSLLHNIVKSSKSMWRVVEVACRQTGRRQWATRCDQGGRKASRTSDSDVVEEKGQEE